MSGAAKNIQRDCIWCQPYTAGVIGLSTEALMTTATCSMNSSGSVNTDKASAQLSNGAAYSVTLLNKRAFGVLMTAPTVDRVPYRIKSSMKNTARDCAWFIVIGYAPASPTGTNDLLDEPVYLPFDGDHFDDTIIVETLADTDPNYGRALGVGVAVMPGAAAISSDPLIGHISVQRLSVKPPTMAQAVA